jgi:FkbM family methyltransferase
MQNIWENETKKQTRYRWNKDINIDDKFNTKIQYNYQLNENSLVLDVGGYKGGWTRYADEFWHCNILIFEPVTEFYNYCVNRFENNNKIKVFKYGLEDEEKKIKIALDGGGSSTYRTTNNVETIQIKSISNVINNELNIKSIDLLKLNIEGGEYKLLDDLDSSNLLKNIKYLQIQFHDDMDKDGKKREKALKIISKTHKIDNMYKYIWAFFSLR